MRTVRVLLADDHPIVLEGLTAMLATANDLQLVGRAASTTEALALLDTTCPDVAVLDISMPGSTECDLAGQCAARYPHVKILILTVHEERALVERALQAGVRGYLLKRSAAEDLVRAIRAVVAGGTYIDPSVAGKILPVATTTIPLSKREQSVLQMVAQGLSSKEAAGRLALSPKTVATYRARAIEKIGARSREDIVRYGIMHGWLNPG
jgi:DNA-binding NarL/FixJ family response regulator